MSYRAARRVGSRLLVSGTLVALIALSAPDPAVAQQVLPCDGGGSGSYPELSEPGRYEPLDQEILSLESDIDGAAIQMGIVRPDVPENVSVPVIVSASVYLHPLQDMDIAACWPFLFNNYVPQGYAVVFLAVRGTADSGGCMNLMGPEERADINQAITWLARRPWSSGSVGMIGKSYDGSTPWMAASFGNPHLKTVVSASGVPDLFALMFGAGTPDWRGPGVLENIYYAQSALFYAPGRSPEHTAEVLACPEYAEGNAASLYSGATGLLDPLGYWEDRRYTDDVLKRYRGSIFIIQGLQDWNVNPGQQFPFATRLEERGLHVKYMLGQWGHSWPYDNSNHYRGDFADILLEWFDRWLRDDRSADLGPRVQVEDTGGEWRNASSWPPLDAERVTFWLTAEEGLADRPSPTEGSALLATDPLHTQHGYSYDMPPEGLETMCTPGTCAYFETGTLKRELRIAGLPRLDLNVVPSGPGGGLSAYLYAVTDDVATRIGWGQVNLAFKAPGEPRVVTAGAPMKLRFDLQPMDAMIPAGSRLALVIGQGSSYNRLLTIPAYPIELLEGGRLGALTVLDPRPSARAFFKPPH